MRETEDESTRKTACNEKCVEYPTTITITFKHCADYSGIAKSVKMKIMNKSTSRILSILLTLIIASASWTGAKAQYWEVKEGTTANVDGIYYLIDDFTHTATVTGEFYDETESSENKYKDAVIIPETFVTEVGGEPYTVIGIMGKAFYNCPALTSVSIPKTVTTIGSQAFDGSDNLEAITVNPQSQSFYAKDGILYNKLQTELIFCRRSFAGKFTVSNDIVKIHAFAFNNCKKITEVVLPNGLKEIGNGAFSNCTAMKSINLPTGLIILGNNAFRNATSLTSNIIIPVSVSTINNDTFRGCSKITNVTIPEGITSIGENAFRNCTSITSIELPASINSIGNAAFASTGLTSINIPSGISEISNYAVQGCKLTSISLPEGLQKIGLSAFSSNNTTIGSVSIPQSVTHIDDNAFFGTNVNNFYINNIPSRITISAYDPFNVSGTTIHVFTLMKDIFENATNWSRYKGHIVADIEITHVESITLDKEEMTVQTNGLGKLNATINPDNAHVKDVVFTSSNDKIVLIVNRATGDFMAGSEEGDAYITCTAADGTGIYETCKVTVIRSFVPAESVTLNQTEKSMNAGEQFKLTATVAPANATYKNVIWVSSDEDVAEVSNTGLVTAKKPGVATITAISQDGAARAKSTIVVSYQTLTLKDGSPYKETEVLPVGELTYERTFNNTFWQALYVPFRMSYEDWKDKFDVAKLLNIHSYDKDGDGQIETLDIEIVRIKEGTLKENHPYLIQAKNTGKQSITINNATIYPAENNSIQCASTENTCDFIGAYEITNVPYSGGYVLKSGEFKKSSATATINPYRYYLQITAKDGQLVSNITNAKIIVFDEFGIEETTDINSVESDKDSVTAVYNANGIKQTSTKQGLNIIKMADGTTKKFFVK